MNSKYLICIALIASFFLTNNKGRAQPAELEAKFLFKSHTYGGITIPFRLFVPENYDSSILYPVVLALHGSGEMGTNNTSQIHVHRMATAWADPVNQEDHPCFVVAPQAPVGLGWYDFTVMANVLNLLDSLINVYSIDSNRQYITGLSMGGYATWEAINSFPERFAAAIPMSGWKNESNVSRIMNVPIWDVHGQNDASVPVSSSRVLMEAFTTSGRKVVYTNNRYRETISLSQNDLENQIDSHANLIYSEIPGSTHGDNTWTNFYNNPSLIKWTFSQYREDTSAIKLTNFNTTRTITYHDTIKWSSSCQDNTIDIWFSPNDGGSWKQIVSSQPNSGSYLWDISAEEDCMLGKIRILLKDSTGNIIGSDQSANFYIDNPQDGIPYLKIMDNETNKTSYINADSLQLNICLGDLEQNPLSLFLFYIYDYHNSIVTLDWYTTTENGLQTFNTWIRLDTLPYSATSYIKAVLTDSVHICYDSTLSFTNARGIMQTSLKHNLNDDNFITMYPNPTRDILKIRLGKLQGTETCIEIYNLLGQMVYNDMSMHDTTIDVSGMQKGSYIIKIKSANGKTLTKTIIVE